MAASCEARRSKGPAVGRQIMVVCLPAFRSVNPVTFFVFACIWILWPVIAFMGGLGFSLAAALGAILLLPLAIRSVRPRLYAGSLLLFLVYAGVSAGWSPRPTVLVEFDFTAMKFAVRSEMIRVGLLLLALGILIAAALRLSEPSRRALAVLSQVMLIVQTGVLVTLALFEQQALDLLSGFMPDSGEGVQNISRNSLIMALALPFLALGLLRSGAAWGRLLAVIACSAALFVLVYRGVDAGLLILAAATLFMLIIRVLPRHGFKLIGFLIAALILSAPWVLGALTAGADFATADDSVTYRAAIWHRVIELIHQDPVVGHGLGVLRTIREPIEAGVFAGQFTIPNHAHNMILQLWAETGAIGAGLLSVTIVLAGWRLPPMDKVRHSAYLAAALAGGLTAAACVSFDLWNEWWWAVGGLLAALAVAAPREVQIARPAVRTITFGEDRASTTAITSGGSAEDRVPETAPTQTNLSADAAPIERSSVGSVATRNNFHLVRLILALMVAAYHAVVLPGIAGWGVYESPFSLAAELGVQGFFVVSGYLVFMSLERSASLIVYADKRIRRLVPAYATVILICALSAVMFSEAARADLAAVLRYTGWNLAFLNFMAPDLPGLFEANRFSEVNGALWTLKIEVMFYIILPVLGWMLHRAGRYRWVLMALIYVGAETWRVVFEHLAAAQSGGILLELSRQLPGQMSFFITGIALAAWRDQLTWKSALFLLGVGLLMASVFAPSLDFLRAAGIGIVVIFLATGLPELFNAARLGDFSYGIYIVHFPILQGLIAAGLFVASPWLGLGCAILATVTAAALLWRLVERPALRPDSAYR